MSARYPEPLSTNFSNHSDYFRARSAWYDNERVCDEQEKAVERMRREQIEHNKKMEQLAEERNSLERQAAIHAYVNSTPRRDPSKELYAELEELNNEANRLNAEWVQMRDVRNAAIKERDAAIAARQAAESELTMHKNEIARLRELLAKNGISESTTYQQKNRLTVNNAMPTIPTLFKK